jgi:hypothetical protein
MAPGGWPVSAKKKPRAVGRHERLAMISNDVYHHAAEIQSNTESAMSLDAKKRGAIRSEAREILNLMDEHERLDR